MRRRVRQFLEAGRRPTESDLAVARAHLDVELLALFLAQHPRDVVHAVTTARWLLARGHDDRDLVTAALVHDVGKGNQRRLDRVAYVLASGLRLHRVLAADRSRFELRRAIARSAGHPDRGATLLEAAGAPARVVELTRRHHAPAARDGMLVLLQQADSLS
jgi:hypothetical protein